MPSFYYKEIAERPLGLSNGRKHYFTPFPDGRSYVKTEDAWLISEFNAAADRKVGGLVKISEAQYEEALKKNENLRELKRRSLAATPLRQNVRIGSNPNRSVVGAARAANVDSVKQFIPPRELPKPLEVPPPGAWRPIVGRMNAGTQ